MKRKITAYEIALSGVAAALATILLSVGTLSSALLFTGYLAASLCLCLPLVRGSYRGYAFAYLATCLLSLLFCGVAVFFRVLPFILFFGLHPLFNELQLKKRINKIVSFIIKAVWFDGALVFIWWVIFGGVIGGFYLGGYIIPIVLIVGTLLFFLYDKMYFSCRFQLDKILFKLFKK